MMAHRVYLLTDPRNPQKGYVGQTTHPIARRYSQHLNGARRGADLPVHRWIRSLARAGVVPGVRVVRTCESQAEVNDAERELIAVCRTLYQMKLYNVTEGGEGTRGAEFGRAVSRSRARPEVKAKHSEAQRRLWANPAHRAKRLASVAASHDAEYRAAAGKRSKDRWQATSPADRAERLAKAHTDESRRIRSDKMKAKWADPEYKARVSAAISAAHSTPDRRAAQSERAKKVNADPIARSRIAAGRAAAWADPVKRARRIASMRASSMAPARRAKRSAATTAMWSDPANRARISASIAANVPRGPRSIKPCGTYGRYKQGCRCADCRRANATYASERRHAAPNVGGPAFQSQ